MSLKHFCQRWLINTIGVLVAANIVSGVDYDTYTGLVVASLLLGILNAFLKPLLMLFSLPFLIVTLGLFTLVINAGLLYLVGQIVKTFHVHGFWSAFWGALIISFISLLGNRFISPRNNSSAFSLRTYRRRRNARGAGDPGKGPIIDV